MPIVITAGLINFTSGVNTNATIIVYITTLEIIINIFIALTLGFIVIFNTILIIDRIMSFIIIISYNLRILNSILFKIILYIVPNIIKDNDSTRLCFVSLSFTPNKFVTILIIITVIIVNYIFFTSFIQNKKD